MDRRRFLGALGAGIAGSAAGCSGGELVIPPRAGSGEPGSNDAAIGSASGGDSAGDAARAGALVDPELPLDDGDLRRGAPKDAIPAITDPAFGADWSAVDATLGAEERVIGVATDDAARAYPLAVLNWHEVVNDEFDGPLLVTYCPLCGSGVTAERRVDGRATTFGVSGLLWMADLVMYDEHTGSLWSQVLGTAVKGPQTGTRLAFRPSTITTWGEWRSEYPDTEVLLPPPASITVHGEVSRDYDRNPYADYDRTRVIGIPGSGAENDDRLHPKTSVIGVASGDTARAYPVRTVRERGGVVNDRVGDLPVVVALAGEGSLVAYDRRVDGQALSFERNEGFLTGGGSRWNPVSSRAVSGPHEGATLRRANDRSQMFWFSWAGFYPETEVFGPTTNRWEGEPATPGGSRP